MKTKLITGGCSFSLTSQNIKDHHPTWPDFLAQELDADLTSKAMGSQGNGLISRGVIYEVSQRLHEADEMLVAIMWSGTDRHEIYTSEPLFENIDMWAENPTGFVNSRNKNWQILNPHWMTEKSDIYYHKLHHATFGYINTMEHILRTQWLLQKYNINYFMTSFMDIFKDMPRTKELTHLYALVDWEKFLPIRGMYEWCDGCEGTGDHPSVEQHERFVKEVINEYLHS